MARPIPTPSRKADILCPDPAHLYNEAREIRALFMTSPPRTPPLCVALYFYAALLAVIAITMLARSTVPQFLPLAMAQQPAQQAIAGGAGVFIMPAQFSSNLWGCYLMDVDAQTLCAYQ